MDKNGRLRLYQQYRQINPQAPFNKKKGGSYISHTAFLYFLGELIQKGILCPHKIYLS